MNLQVRLFFPLFPITQIIGGVDTAYKKEIDKVRRWGSNYITPRLKARTYNNYPYKITIIFRIYDDFDMISMLLFASYILRLLTQHCFQSADYRVIPHVVVKSKPVQTKDGEGCELIIEHLKIKPEKHKPSLFDHNS